MFSLLQTQTSLLLLFSRLSSQIARRQQARIQQQYKPTPWARGRWESACGHIGAMETCLVRFFVAGALLSLASAFRAAFVQNKSKRHTLTESN